ncbi:GNAT family N-acetyltransferase [Demequina sp.]|uniref:GNAT family N-acetyltransferase n=1 Tax=Demequina sp. TaxID=2050685 RepID=UPI0025BBAC92|nr:GNAT family N-acetyltransferase [Demequina sp.]
MSQAVVEVRRASGDDAAELARLLTAFNAEYDAAVPPQEVLEDRYRAMLSGPDFVALLAGTPAVGFATVALRPSVYHEGRVGLLEDLFVAPERRNEGIGAALVGELAAIALDEGWGQLEVQVDEPDVDAMRFYARHGFISRDETNGDRALLWWRTTGPI